MVVLPVEFRTPLLFSFTSILVLRPFNAHSILLALFIIFCELSRSD